MELCSVEEIALTFNATVEHTNIFRKLSQLGWRECTEGFVHLSNEEHVFVPLSNDS